MEDYIGYVANALDYEISVDEIHANLIAKGLTEAQAFYTYMAGRIIHNDRVEDSIAPTERTPSFVK